MKFYTKEEKKSQEKKEDAEAKKILFSVITAPVTGVVISVATTLLMLGFSGGQAIIEYNQKLEAAQRELAALRLELLNLQKQNEQFHANLYDKQETEQRFKYLTERIKSLEERILRLEKKYFN